MHQSCFVQFSGWQEPKTKEQNYDHQFGCFKNGAELITERVNFGLPVQMVLQSNRHRD